MFFASASFACVSSSRVMAVADVSNIVVAHWSLSFIEPVVVGVTTVTMPMSVEFCWYCSRAIWPTCTCALSRASWFCATRLSEALRRIWV